MKLVGSSGPGCGQLNTGYVLVGSRSCGCEVIG